MNNKKLKMFFVLVVSVFVGLKTFSIKALNLMDLKNKSKEKIIEYKSLLEREANDLVFYFAVDLEYYEKLKKEFETEKNYMLVKKKELETKIEFLKMKIKNFKLKIEELKCGLKNFSNLELENLDLEKQFKEEIFKIKNELSGFNLILKQEKNSNIFEKNRMLSGEEHLKGLGEDKLLFLEFSVGAIERSYAVMVNDFEKKILNFAICLEDVIDRIFNKLKIENLNDLVFENLNIFEFNFKIFLNKILKREFNLEQSLKRDLETKELKYFLEKIKRNRVLDFIKKIFVINLMFNDEKLKEQFKMVEKKDVVDFVKQSFESRKSELEKELKNFLNDYEKKVIDKELQEEQINCFVKNSEKKIKDNEQKIKEKSKYLETLKEKINYLKNFIKNYGKS